jgi:hypothetical protein
MWPGQRRRSCPDSFYNFVILCMQGASRPMIDRAFPTPQALADRIH